MECLFDGQKIDREQFEKWKPFTVDFWVRKNSGEKDEEWMNVTWVNEWAKWMDPKNKPSKTEAKRKKKELKLNSCIWSMHRSGECCRAVFCCLEWMKLFQEFQTSFCKVFFLAQLALFLRRLFINNFQFSHSKHLSHRNGQQHHCDSCTRIKHHFPFFFLLQKDTLPEK